MHDSIAREHYRACWKAWGEDFELIVLMEECAELIVAASKRIRKNQGAGLEALIEELADASIMVQTTILGFDIESEVAEMVRTKNARTALLLKEWFRDL